jgi:hypothetical protein
MGNTPSQEDCKKKYYTQTFNCHDLDIFDKEEYLTCINATNKHEHIVDKAIDLVKLYPILKVQFHENNTTDIDWPYRVSTLVNEFNNKKYVLSRADGKDQEYEFGINGKINSYKQFDNGYNFDKYVDDHFKSNHGMKI